MTQVIKIDQATCVGCGACVADCPHHALAVEDGAAHMVTDSCMECGHCVAVCPKGAVSMEGYDMTESIPIPREGFELDADAWFNKIRGRRSVRRFRDEPVGRADVERIIQAGRFTPTGSNEQGVRYIVVEDPTTKIEPAAIKAFSGPMAVGRAVGKVLPLPVDVGRFKLEEGFFFHHAPVVVLVVSDDEVDAALAAANMGTMAESLGLGLFYVGLYTRAVRLSGAIRRQLGLARGERVVAAIALGHPAVRYRRTVPRRPARVEWR